MLCLLQLFEKIGRLGAAYLLGLAFQHGCSVSKERLEFSPFSAFSAWLCLAPWLFHKERLCALLPSDFVVFCFRCLLVSVGFVVFLFRF